MKRKLFLEFNQLLNTKSHIENKTEIYDQEYLQKINDMINNCISELPHGSGINYDWHIDYPRFKYDKVIVLYNSFDAMTEYGMYDTVIHFTVKITASFNQEYDLLITGNFGKYQSIKEYLYEIMYDALSQEVEVI